MSIVNYINYIAAKNHLVKIPISKFFKINKIDRLKGHNLIKPNMATKTGEPTTLKLFRKQLNLIEANRMRGFTKPRSIKINKQ